MTVIGVVSVTVCLIAAGVFFSRETPGWAKFLSFILFWAVVIACGGSSGSSSVDWSSPSDLGSDTLGSGLGSDSLGSGLGSDPLGSSLPPPPDIQIPPDPPSPTVELAPIPVSPVPLSGSGP